MDLNALLSKTFVKKAIAVVLLLIFTLLSIFVFSKPATNPETYAATIRSIDEKKATVMGLTASATAASTALAAIPGDVTTPIANQVMEISAYLLIVVCVLVLEKSLLTVMGYLSFNILIPISCALLAIYTFFKKDTLKILATKFLIFALVIVTVIPFSLKISDFVYEINKSTIAQVTTTLDKSVAQENEQEEDTSWLDKVLNTIQNSVSSAAETAKQILNNFIDAIAMFLIVYCVIPILIVLIVVWFIKFLFGITIPISKINPTKLLKKKNPKKREKEELPV